MPSKSVSGKSFANQTLRIDDTAYSDVVFTNCTLEYSGGPHPGFSNCQFVSSPILFVESAERLLVFLQSFYAAGGHARGIAQGAIDFIQGQPPAPHVTAH